MPVGGQIHVYHLQRRRPGTKVSDVAHDSIGHAVTSNLIDWEQRPLAFGPNASNPYDDLQPWLGCAVWHEGRGYFFYTMRGSADHGQQQHIALATTTDPDHWQRYEHNPIITPDSRWYSTLERPIPGTTDCRDLIVVRAPDNQGWYGFFASRQPGKELPETSVIACAYSRDLIHWDQRPPAFAPAKYDCIEVPNVFELNGRWYLTCLTGDGNRGKFSEPNLTAGTIYAVAERPEGPYQELADNVLLGAKSGRPISCRTVAFEGENYLLYTDMEREGHIDNGNTTLGTLTTPKLLRTDGERLYAAYSPRIESRVSDELVGMNALPQLRLDKGVWGAVAFEMSTATWESGDSIRGYSRTGWGVASLGVAADSFIFEVTVILLQGVAAGVTLRMNGPKIVRTGTKQKDKEYKIYSGSVIALDASDRSVFYAGLPGFESVEHRSAPISIGKPIRLRVVSRLEHLEVYVDDELKLAFNRYLNIGGELGLFVDRGDAQFSDIRVRALRISRPS